MYGPPPFRKRKVRLAFWSAQMYTAFVGEDSLLAMMECAALCSSLNRQPCKGYFAPQVSRVPGSTVVPSPCSPADLAGNHKLRRRRGSVDVGIAPAISKPGFSQASSAGQSGCSHTGQHRG